MRRRQMRWDRKINQNEGKRFEKGVRGGMNKGKVRIPPPFP